MINIDACAGCLATDYRMRNIVSSGLLQPFQMLTQIQVNDMPAKLCWECSALVTKFNTFRLKCERARTLLQRVYIQHGEDTIDTIKLSDRENNMLLSRLNITKPFFYTLESQNVIVMKNYNNHNPILNEEHESKIIKTEEVLVKSEPSFDFVESNVEDYGTDATIEEAESKEKDECMKRKSVKVRKRKRKKKPCIYAFKATETLLTQEEATAIYTQRKKSQKYENSRYKCEFCYTGFKIVKLYNKHMARHDPNRGSKECDLCKMKFRTRKMITRHIYNTHMKKYTCNICSKVSYSRNVAKSHYELHQKMGPIVSRLKKKKVLKKRKNTKQVRSKKNAMEDKFESIEESQSQEQMMCVISDRQHTESYKTSPFKCLLCYKTFLESKTYTHHMLLHDPAAGEFECDICKQRVRTRNKLHKHMSNNHLRKYTCKICAYVCYNKNSARGHYSWHKGVTYTCHICGATFGKMSSHLSHIRIKHPSDHVCGICSLSFVSPMGLVHHKRIMHSLKSDKATENESENSQAGAHCATCDIHFATEQARTRHILISPRHDNERTTITNGCRVCGETFATRLELRHHRSISHPPKFERRKKPPAPAFVPKPCVECGMMMTSSRKYRAHFQRQHGGEPSPFPSNKYSHMCETCGKGFQCNASLVIHRNIHTGAHQYRCSLCPKTFLLPLNLKQHQATHSEERPHGCNLCGKAFKLANALGRHVKSHSGEKPYSCTLCGKAFPSSTGRNAHMRAVHHKEPPVNPIYRRRVPDCRPE